MLKYPPYYYMTYVKVISDNYELLKNESNLIAAKLKDNLKDSIVLGPSIGSIFKVKNTYRFMITIKYKKEDNLYNYLDLLLEHYSSNSKIRLDIDFNPIL